MRNSLFFIVYFISIFSAAAHAGNLDGLIIGIDPGHGGGDPGAVANGLRESDINLTTAIALKQFLEADGAKVIMSRTTDVSTTTAVSGRTELASRARFFNSRGVNYLISIHHNAASPSANGVLAYIPRGTCNRPAGALGRETVINLIANNGLSVLRGGQSSSTPCTGKAGVFEFNAVILAESTMPSTLAEVSFVTNPTEAERLKRPEYLRSNGWALYASFVRFLGQGEPLPLNTNTSTTPTNPTPAQLPTLNNPVNGAVDVPVSGATLNWRNNNPAAQLSSIALTLQEATENGSLPSTPRFVGDCNAKVLSVRESYSTTQCGILKSNQWYQWQLRLRFTNNNIQQASAFFRTSNVNTLNFDCATVSQIPRTECQTLLNFYQNTNGRTWADAADNQWLKMRTPCSWRGIVCTSGRVTQIDRRNQRLTGVLPDLSALTTLQTLLLGNNQLTGFLPAKHLPSTLQVLSLPNNQFTGNLPNFTQLTRLRSLQLNNNRWCGDIPVSLGNLRNLATLELDNNFLSTRNATLASFITRLNPGWQLNQKAQTCPLTQPDLGIGTSLDKLGQELPTNAWFSAGVIANDAESQANLQVKLTDSVDIRTAVVPDTTHIGQTADIIITAPYLPVDATTDTTPQQFMLTETGGVVIWDEEPASLVRYRQIQLDAFNEIPLYQGQFVLPGRLDVYIRYRLADGTLVSNLQPMMVDILP